uniref:Transposase Synechocystis PCC 6803 domain-containing protein n=1 Tax=Globodera rostochiensis TaxID=31243 RepID=A0A914HP73_GLORO
MIEAHEEQMDGRCPDESALKETLKIKHEPHYGAVNVEDVKVKSEQYDESQKDFIKVKVEEVGPSVIEHGQQLTSTSARTKDGAQTSMELKRQLPIVLDAKTSVSVEAEHESLKMILPLSKSARRIRARSKMPQNESSEEDNCSEESEEANHSRETFEESDYSETNDFEEIDHSSNKKVEQNSGKRIHYTEEEKLKIVNKFLKMKQNLYNSGDKRPYQEINKEIADKLNVNIRTIYMWKQNFGHTIYYSEKEKLEIVNKFLKLKYELNNNNKKGKRPYREINKEIADKLNVHIRTIYKWKKNFDHKIIHSEEEKLEIVNKFLQIKRELCNKGDKRLCKEIDKEIADKFGVTIGTICKWIKKFGFSTLKRFTSEQKIELVKRLENLKKENPKLKKKEIAKKLQISCSYLNQLIKQIPLGAAKPNEVTTRGRRKNAVGLQETA